MVAGLAAIVVLQRNEHKALGFYHCGKSVTLPPNPLGFVASGLEASGI